MRHPETGIGRNLLLLQNAGSLDLRRRAPENWDACRTKGRVLGCAIHSWRFLLQLWPYLALITSKVHTQVREV